MPANKPNPTGWGWQGKNKQVASYADATQSGLSDEMLRRYATQQKGMFAKTHNPVLRAEQAKLGEKLAEGLEAKLDAQLELEFKQWLNGVHPVNCSDAKDRKAMVMDVIRDQSNNYNPAMDPHKNLRTFTHTWWRTNDLKHLPGVRDYLTTDEQKVREEKLKLSKLAHFGPQNVQEAWAYFKTFVKDLEEDPVAFDPTMSNYWRNYPALQGDDTDKTDKGNIDKDGRYKADADWTGANKDKDGKECTLGNAPPAGADDDGVNRTQASEGEPVADQEKRRSSFKRSGFSRTEDIGRGMYSDVPLESDEAAQKERRGFVDGTPERSTPPAPPADEGRSPYISREEEQEFDEAIGSEMASAPE